MQKIKEVVSNRRVLQEYHHESGFKHIHVPMPFGELAGSIRLYTPALSDKGLQHQLEHCSYLGTSKYEGHDLFEMLQGKFLTTNANAITFNSHTFYEFSAVEQGSFTGQTAVHLEMLLRPALDPVRVAKEQYVVFNEMIGRMANGYTYQMVGHLARKTYGETNPLAYMSGGYPEQVAATTLDELKQYHAQHYFIGNMTLMTVGPLDVEAFHQALRPTLDAERHTAGRSVPSTEFIVQPQAFDTVEVVKVNTTLPSSTGYAVYYPFQHFTAADWSVAELVSDLFVHSDISFSSWRDHCQEGDISGKASIQMLEVGHVGMPGLLAYLVSLGEDRGMAQQWQQYLAYLEALDEETWHKVLQYRKQRIRNIMYLMDTTSDASAIILERLQERSLVSEDVLSRYEPENMATLMAMCDDPSLVRAWIRTHISDVKPVALYTEADPQAAHALEDVAHQHSQHILQRIAKAEETAPCAAKPVPVHVQWPTALPGMPPVQQHSFKEGAVQLDTYYVDHDKTSVLTLVFPLSNLSSKYLFSAKLVCELLDNLDMRRSLPCLSEFFILHKRMELTSLFKADFSVEVAAECQITYLTEYADKVLEALQAWLFTVDFKKMATQVESYLHDAASEVLITTTQDWIHTAGLLAQTSFLPQLAPRMLLQSDYILEYLPHAQRYPALATWQSVYASLFNSTVHAVHVSGMGEEERTRFNAKLCAIFKKPVKKRVIPLEKSQAIADYSEFTTSNAIAAAVQVPSIADTQHWVYALLAEYLNIQVVRAFRVEQGAYTASLHYSPVGSYLITLVDLPEVNKAIQVLLSTNWLDVDNIDHNAWESAKVQYLQQHLQVLNPFEHSLNEWDKKHQWLTVDRELPVSLQEVIELDAAKALKIARDYLLPSGTIEWNIQVMGDLDITALTQDGVNI